MEYTPAMPRRSRRARSIVNRFSSDNYPLLKVEKDPENPKTVPRIIRSRSLDVYAEDENPANASRQYSNFFYEEMRRNVGQIRIPLVTEVLQMSQYMIKMRNIEIDFIEDVIGKMIEQKVEQELIDIWETALKALKWEIDPNNVMEDDLPPLGTNNYVDISVFVIIYFEKIHENFHRIQDLEHFLNLFSDEQRRSLRRHRKDSGKLFLDFKKFANQLEMPDLSRKKYQSVSSGIIRNCESCNPK